jgi:hypothetical protein
MKTLPDDRVVTINEARKHGLCVKGLTAWARGQGLDVRDMVRNGLTVGEIRRIDDGFGNALLERMERNS